MFRKLSQSISIIALCALIPGGCHRGNPETTIPTSPSGDDVAYDESESNDFIFSYEPLKDTVSDTCNIFWGIDSDSGHYLDKGYYFNNFNIEYEIPYWVAYHLSPAKLENNYSASLSFVKDPALPNDEQASDGDYLNSGWDRGHNAPAAAFRRSEEAYRSTFLWTNASPQQPDLNQNMWRLLEEMIRDSVMAWGNGWIFTGNLFLDYSGDSTLPDSFLGDGHVAVPTHLFKTVLVMRPDSTFGMGAFLLPNRVQDLSGTFWDYLITVDELEERTGYDFYFLLEDSLEDSLESHECTAVGK